MWLIHGDDETLHEYLKRSVEPFVDGFGFRISGQAATPAKPSLSLFYAIVLFGLGGVIPGLAVGAVGSLMGDWFSESSLIVRILAKILVGAIIGVITGFIAGAISGGIFGLVLSRIMAIAELQKVAYVQGGGLGLMIGLFGGPICAFIAWPIVLLVGGFGGPGFGLTFAFVAMYLPLSPPP